MQYATVTQTARGYLVFVGKQIEGFHRAEQVHSYLGSLGARKVFAMAGAEGSVVGTYLLPRAVETRLAIEG